MMFRHVLVKAGSSRELSAIMNMNSDQLMVVRQKPFETRLAATEFLQLKFALLRRYRAIAASVLLPTTSDYADAVAELNALGERLRSLPTGWSAAKERLEKKILEQVTKLRYMEKQQPTEDQKSLTWVVYLAAEQDYEKLDRNRPLLQQAS